MTRAFQIAVVGLCVAPWMAASSAFAAVNFSIPDLTVYPGQSGTFDALVEFTGTPPSAGSFLVNGYSVRIRSSPRDEGFRMPSAADGLIFGAGIITDSEDVLESTNGLYCTNGLPGGEGCGIGFAAGSHLLLLRGDFQVHSNVPVGMQYSLTFEPGATGITNEYGMPYAIAGFQAGKVTVSAPPAPILGGPIGPGDIAGGGTVEHFESLGPSPVATPLAVANAVISTDTGGPLNISSPFLLPTGKVISQRANEQIIVDFTVDTLQAGAYISGPTPNEVHADFYSGNTLLGGTTLHTIYGKQVFLGFESLSGFITRAVFSSPPSGVNFSLDRLTTAPFGFEVPGDFNGDGFVDAADYTVLRASQDGVQDQEEYALWKQHFGETAASIAAAAGGGAGSLIPEPNLAALLIPLGLLARRRIRLS